MVERLSTGIPGLDEMVEGGLEKNRVIVISGNSGSGKTTFASCFAHNGLEQKEKVLYVSLEEKPENMVSNMQRIGLDFMKYMKNNSFHFLYLSPEELQYKNKLIDKVSNLVTHTTYSRIVIDSITPYLHLFAEEVERRDSLAKLLSIIRSNGSTVVLTNEIEYKASLLGLSYLVDGVINLLYKEKPDGITRIRLIEVYKMRGTNHAINKVIFKIEPGDGVRITKTQPFI